ncbi:membrane protein insertion efficiency factor YidD [Nostoc cycadae]|nr:membrane protein insertion efficiency factor YidD [Nostoc cycadae]
MQISLLDSLSRKVSVTAIAGYQKHISPHKGFVCAHRILYGSESCSQYIKRVIAQEGLSIAFIKSRARFQACKQANLILRLQSHNSEPTESEDEANIQPPKTENRSNNQQSSNTICSNGDGTNCIDCADLSCDCADLVNVLPDCDFSHCHALDCSVVDCSGADCSFLDCGSCGS